MATEPKCTCHGDRPAYAKGLCQASYRRQLRDPAADIHAPVRESRGDLLDLSTRVTSETRAALETLGGAYSGAATVLESWARGERLPKAPKRARRAA